MMKLYIYHIGFKIKATFFSWFTEPFHLFSVKKMRFYNLAPEFLAFVYS